MMGTPHVLAGAAVACAVKRPALAVPAAVASHLVLDYLPHLDSHGLLGRAGGALTAGEVGMGLVEGLFAAALVVWLARRRSDSNLVILGAVCGVVIDLVCNVPPFRGWMDLHWATSWFRAFHHDMQHNLPRCAWRLGFGTQMVVSAAALFYLLRDRSGKKDPLRV